MPVVLHSCTALQRSRLELLLLNPPNPHPPASRDVALSRFSCCHTHLACGPVGAFGRLLTAAVCVEVLLQSCYVSEPAQNVDMLWIWGPVEELKGFLVSLGGAEPSQVAA